MKSFGTLFVAAAVLLAAPLAARAQADKPAAEPAAKPAAKRTRSDVDARKCLELATNIEIHKCAEKYR